MKTLNQIKIEYIKKVLLHCDNNRIEACRILDISPRGLRNIINANSPFFADCYKKRALDIELDRLMNEIDNSMPIDPRLLSNDHPTGIQSFNDSYKLN